MERVSRVITLAVLIALAVLSCSDVKKSERPKGTPEEELLIKAAQEEYAACLDKAWAIREAWEAKVRAMPDDRVESAETMREARTWTFRWCEAQAVCDDDPDTEEWEHEWAVTKCVGCAFLGRTSRYIGGNWEPLNDICGSDL